VPIVGGATVGLITLGQGLPAAVVWLVESIEPALPVVPPALPAGLLGTVVVVVELQGAVVPVMPPAVPVCPAGLPC
jgi:hypothetical protein